MRQNQRHLHDAACPCTMHRLMAAAMLVAGMRMGTGPASPDADGPFPSFSDEMAREPTDYVMAEAKATAGLFETADAGQTVIVSNVTVLPMTATERLESRDVVLRDGKIAGIEAAGSVRPDGAIHVDGTGKYLMPGLTDIHQHPTLHVFAQMYAPLVGPDIGAHDLTLPYDLVNFQYLAGGVTRIQVMAGTIEEMAMRDAIRAGRYYGPHMRIGMLIDGSPMVWSPLMTLIANDREGGRKAVESIVERGFDFVKPYTQLNAEAYAGIAEAARAIGIESCGHVPRAVLPEDALAQGQTGIAHIMEYFWNNRAEDRVTDARFAMLARRTAEHGAIVQTTLTAARALEYDCGYMSAAEFDLSVAKDNLLRYIMREESPFIQGWRADPVIMTGSVDALAHSVRMIQALLAEGVTILPGTDIFPSAITGKHTVHDEIEMFVNLVGMSPLDTLKAATIKCAEYQGDSANAGTVEIGKRADLVLLDVDPTADITATNAIDTVFINGAILRKAARAEGIKRLEAAYDAMPVPRV